MFDERAGFGTAAAHRCARGNSDALFLGTMDGEAYRRYQGVWARLPCAVGAKIQGIHAISASKAYLLRSDGEILLYDGTSCSQVHQSADSNFLGIAQLTATTFYAYRQNGGIFFDGSTFKEFDAPYLRALSSGTAPQTLGVGFYGRSFTLSGANVLIHSWRAPVGYCMALALAPSGMPCVGCVGSLFCLGASPQALSFRFARQEDSLEFDPAGQLFAASLTSYGLFAGPLDALAPLGVTHTATALRSLATGQTWLAAHALGIAHWDGKTLTFEPSERDLSAERVIDIEGPDVDHLYALTADGALLLRKGGKWVTQHQL
ncbi:MAG: hypothetical protein JRH20_30060, partial [Deltaproteobacteria bacterium]|nr:hypothetical protein [Deltaproteobacteria bacterium]